MKWLLPPPSTCSCRSRRSWCGSRGWAWTLAALLQLTALGQWYEANQIYPSADTFVLPVASEPIEIRLRARMWDHDSGVGNGDDLITSISRDYWFPSLENALSNLYMTSDCVAEFETGFQQNGTAITLANYNIEVFPNDCRDSP